MPQDVPTKSLISILSPSQVEKLDGVVLSFLSSLVEGEDVYPSGVVYRTALKFLREFDVDDADVLAAQIAQECLEQQTEKSSENEEEVDETTATTTALLPQPLILSKEFALLLNEARESSGLTTVVSAQQKTAGNANSTWTWNEKAQEARRHTEEKRTAAHTSKRRAAYEEYLRSRGIQADSLQSILRVHHTAREEIGKGHSRRELRLDNVRLDVGGKVLLDDSHLHIVKGHRYGLIGRNGSGKTSLLRAIAERDIPGIDPFVQIVHVEQEAHLPQASTLTPLEFVLAADVERAALLEEEQMLLESQQRGDEMPLNNSSEERLGQIYERLDEIDAHSAPAEAARMLAGLSFTPQMMDAPTTHLSGGWRMRLIFARALFSQPDLLFLDEPTNHLDLHAVLWLEKFLQSWPHCVVVVSHSRSFLTRVCTDIISLSRKTLTAYKGDYATFEARRFEEMTHQQRAHEAQEAQRAKLQSFVDRFRYKAKGAKMAQSRLKALERMDRISAVVPGSSAIRFRLPDPGTMEHLDNDLLQIADATVSYSPQAPPILNDVTFTAISSTRAGLVGSNGAGKTTFFRLCLNQLDKSLQVSSNALVRLHPKARIGYFAQDHVNQFPMHQTALDVLREVAGTSEPEQALRSFLGGFDLGGPRALQPIYTLSGGQKARLALACIFWRKPHLLLLDEPTNHLDLESVDALIAALLTFRGGVVVVSHDEHFITTLCDELWVCQHGKLNRFDGDFEAYRKHIQRDL